MSVEVSGAPEPEFRWRFGESTQTDWVHENTFEHTPAEPGGFHIQVQVRDGGTRIATGTGLIVIEPVSGPEPPTRSTGSEIGMVFRDRFEEN